MKVPKAVKNFMLGMIIVDNGQNGTRVQVTAEMKDLRTEFSDLVNFEMFQEYVVINFLQTFPNVLPPINDNPECPERMAKIVSRVALPWSHFVRIIPTMQDIAKRQENIADSNHQKAKEILISWEGPEK